MPDEQEPKSGGLDKDFVDALFGRKSTEEVPPKPERHHPEQLMKYAESIEDFDHEGYYWMVLPQQALHFGQLFGGGGAQARVLTCERCGLMVADKAKHEAWHALMEARDALMDKIAEMNSDG